MKLLVYVLSRIERLDALMTELGTRDICGATVLESTGLARYLSKQHDEDEIPFLSSLRTFLSPDLRRSNVIFMVVMEEQVADVIHAIESSVANLDEEDAGIVFTLPVDFVKGACHLAK